jgi:hypothetical protein
VKVKERFSEAGDVSEAIRRADTDEKHEN